MCWRVPATALLILAGIAWVLALLFAAISPASPIYWALALPAMLCFSLGIEFLFIVAGVFITLCLDSQAREFMGSLIDTSSNNAMGML